MNRSGLNLKNLISVGAPPAQFFQIHACGTGLSAAILLALGPICKPAVASCGRLLGKQIVGQARRKISATIPGARLPHGQHLYSDASILYIGLVNCSHKFKTMATAERSMHNCWGASRTFLSIARVRDRAFRCNFLRKRSDRRLIAEHKQDREEGVSSVKARPRL